VVIHHCVSMKQDPVSLHQSFDQFQKMEPLAVFCVYFPAVYPARCYVVPPTLNVYSQRPCHGLTISYHAKPNVNPVL